MLEKELNLGYFQKEGFRRYKCKKCGSYFWSTTPRDNCSEAPCGRYKFLDERIFNKKFEIGDMRKYFIKFFKDRGHTPIHRYPVVARWRDDVFLVNASIYDFQPHVTSGLVEPPANPLVISQPCIRMVDVDSVGKTGRHLTGFEMMAHHAFNYGNNWIYWKDETVRYAVELFESLGVKREDIVFKEHPWFGGGNAGASFEVIVGGLELATLVFMNLKENENGKIEIAGNHYSEMPIKIVDTGYGLERFVWLSKGTPTIYEAIYPNMIEKLLNITGIEKGDKENRVLRMLAYESHRIAELGERRFREKFAEQVGINTKYYDTVITAIQKIYALADYSRSLSFMLTDGIIPSNIQAGYLARLLIRRSLKLLSDFGNPLSLYELVDMHVHRFSDIMDLSMLPVIRDELQIEEKKYSKTIRNGTEIVSRMLKKKRDLSTENLILLYDSHGLLPDVVKQVAEQNGVKLEIPEGFHALVSERHGHSAVKKKKSKVYNLPATKKLYYNEPYLSKFTAEVIYSAQGEIVLDRTAFYPEGGGQPCDLGKIIYKEKEFKIKDVKKYGEVIVHYIDGNIPKNSKVHSILNWERRERLMRMHTAEHVLLAATRKVLGRHIWQHGTQKDVYESRFDIAHYKPISHKEIKNIEREAMRIITSNIEVEAKFMNRREAEEKYGFILYEGGIPPGTEIRVVKIGDYDVEACAGTHVRRTGEIGFIKILRTERIQDGVSRLIYSAGLSALEKVQNLDDLLIKSTQIVNSPVEKLPEKIQNLVNEWKIARKERARAMQSVVTYMAEKLIADADGGKLVAIVNISSEVLQMLMRKLSSHLKEVVLITYEGDIMVWSKTKQAKKIALKVAEAMEGKAGGSDTFAQGHGKINRVKDGFNIAKEDMGYE